MSLLAAVWKLFRRFVMVALLVINKLLGLNLFTRVLNKSRNPGELSEQSAELAEKLRECATGLLNDFVVYEGDVSRVKYDELAASEKFAEYQELARELATVDLDKLSDSAFTAFLINVYNVLFFDAYIQTRPQTLDETFFLFQSCCYNIGGYSFSLDDIEHGLLRGNRKGIACLFTQFGQCDKRRKLVRDKVDPRIHFAINCGGLSCPPVRFYSSDENKLNKELDIATKGYINATTEIQSNGRLSISKLLYYYQYDFVSKTDKYPDDLITYVQRYLPYDKAALVQHAFLDWPNKAAHFIKFAHYDMSSNKM